MPQQPVAVHSDAAAVLARGVSVKAEAGRPVAVSYRGREMADAVRGRASNPKTPPAPPTMPVPAVASTIESRLGRSRRHAR
jgi:hypothetical protein